MVFDFMKDHRDFPIRVASIDIGTNAIRFFACEFISKNRYRVLEAERVAVRLGHHSFQSGRLDEKLQALALQALRGFKRSMRRLDILCYKAVATSAVRESVNGLSFVKRAKKNAGIDIEIISGSEEARLVYVAVKRAIPLAGHRWLIVNLGGGSVEVCFADHSNIIWNQTHTLGSVRLYEQLTNEGKEPYHFKQLILDYISTMKLPLKERMRREMGFIATGGNIEELAKMAGTPADEAGTRILPVSGLRSVIGLLSRYSYKERIKKLSLRKDRADVILPAALVYEKFASMSKARKIIVPYVGTREGIVFDIIDRLISRKVYSMTREKQIRSFAVQIGRKYQYDEMHAFHVADLALSLFDQMKDIVNTDANDRNILLASAILHDVGTFISYKGHHKHSLYLIQQSEIPGLNEREIMMVANIARYHRKSDPSITHEYFACLTLVEQKRVRRLAALLRIADALDRDHRQNIRQVLVSIERSNLLLSLETKGNTCIEEWAIKNKGKLFKRVFGYEAIIRNHSFYKEKIS